jgi:hypothetical protein
VKIFFKYLATAVCSAFVASALPAALVVPSSHGASRPSPIRLENDLIQGAIGKETFSDFIPGLPTGARQQLHSSGCLLRGRVSCEMAMTSVSFVMERSPHTRIRAVFLKRNTGKRISVPKPYGQTGMTDSPVWQIVDGFAFRDEQVLGKPINTRKPFLEMLACEIPGQPNSNIVAIGKVVNPVKENLFITHLKPIYRAWHVDEAQQRFVEIPPEGIECITNSEGHD